MLRHYDLDDIALLNRMIEKMKSSIPELTSSLWNGRGEVSLNEQTTDPIELGRQISHQRTLSWLVRDGGSAINITARFRRFACPPAAMINNTMELKVEPISRFANRSRFLLLTLCPLLGLAVGGLGWRMLQYDTGMILLPWLVIGALVGLGAGLMAMFAWAHRLGAVMEGKQALSHHRNIKEAQQALQQFLARLIDEEIEASAGARKANATDPPATAIELAAYADQMATDPDGAVNQYGLFNEKNRQTIVQAFIDLQNNAGAFQAFREARTQPPKKESPLTEA